jgi:hypothetical protein
LKSEERAEILEILLDTRNDLPEYWHAARPVEEPAPASSSGERKRSL